MSQELLTAFADFQRKHDERSTKLQAQMDGLEQKLAKPIGGSTAPKTIADQVWADPQFKALQSVGRGQAIVRLESKTAITSAAVGSYTTGVLMGERLPGIIPQAQRVLSIRDLLPSQPCAAGAVDYVKVNAFTNAASPQTEASDKAESALTFLSLSAPVRTLAHWIPATRQVLEDFAGLQNAIERVLLYGLRYKEELELLSGDNTGQHLNGLITQATAFNTALLSAAAGYTKADILRRAIQQLESSDHVCDWIILNPVDWADIELMKSTAREYIFDPRAMLGPSLWGRRVLVTNSITSGTFLAGSSQAAVVFDRSDPTIDISTEHSDYFIKNMVAIRVEERLTLVVIHPGAFITGALSTSPVSTTA
jgi:HK97 family phage major capsid protein